MTTMGNFTPEPGMTHGTATLVRRMDPAKWRGDTRLYRLDPPLFGDVHNAVVTVMEESPISEVKAFIGAMLGVDVSKDGGPETMLIPTDEDGDDYSAEAVALNQEHATQLLTLVTTKTTDHDKYLAGVGYQVTEP